MRATAWDGPGGDPGSIGGPAGRGGQNGLEAEIFKNPDDAVDDGGFAGAGTTGNDDDAVFHRGSDRSALLVIQGN